VYQVGVKVQEEIVIGLGEEIEPKIAHHKLSETRHGNPSPVLYQVRSYLEHSEIILINRLQEGTFTFVKEAWTYPYKGNAHAVPKGTMVKICHPAETQTASVFISKIEPLNDNFDRVAQPKHPRMLCILLRWLKRGFNLY